MPQRRLIAFIKDLSFANKTLSLGAILMIISLFLPWYSDLDTFRTGDVFLGLTGPLYLAGYILLLGSVANIAISVLYTLKYRGAVPAFLKKNLGALQFGVSIFSFFLVLLVSSIYFHPQFGLNIILKEPGFGLLLSYFAAAISTFGSYLVAKKIANPLKKFQKQIEEIPTPNPPGANLQPDRMQASIAKKESKPVSSFVPPSIHTSPRVGSNQVVAQVKSSQPSQEGDKKPQAYRMDL